MLSVLAGWLRLAFLRLPCRDMALVYGPKGERMGAVTQLNRGIVAPFLAAMLIGLGLGTGVSVVAGGSSRSGAGYGLLVGTFGAVAFATYAHVLA